MFFAFLEDIEHILKNMETEVDVQYFKTGLMDDKKIPKYNSIFDVPNIGVALYGDWNKLDNYLVMKKDTLLSIREIPQRTGEMKFAVDQLTNLTSIELKLGGFYKDVDNVIVAGRVATVSEDKVSNELFKLFSSKIKKEFKKNWDILCW